VPAELARVNAVEASKTKATAKAGTKKAAPDKSTSQNE
jgi:hypothetical protein